MTAREADGMADRETLTNEQKRQSIVEKMWLHYFNNQLLEKGMISEDMYRKMKIKINSRKPSA